MNIKTTLTRKRFEEWLVEKSFRSNPIVGRHGDPRCCPIANYLKARGGEQVVVGTDNFDCGGRKNIRLPLWAQNFVHLVDHENRIHIRADLALELLTTK